MNIKNKIIKLPVGIWTPSAKVLCPTCHGKVFYASRYNTETHKFENIELNDEEFEKIKESIALKEDYAITKCNVCKEKIQLYDATAYENNLNDELNALGVNSLMSQTGGMNSAIEIEKESNGYILITFDNDGEKEWYLGHYDDEGCPELIYDENGKEIDNYFLTTDKDELINYILDLKNKNIIK